MKTRFLTIIALAAVTLSSCSKNDDNSTGVQPEDGVMRVFTQVEDMTTRAGVTNPLLDANGFGMFVTNNANPTYTYSNQQWTKSGSTWQCVTPLMWQNATTSVGIIAYYPYNTAWSNSSTAQNITIAADQNVNGGERLTAADYLYASSTVTPSGTQNTTNDIYYDAALKGLSVSLKHRMAKLKIAITLGTEYNATAMTANPITNIKLNGAKLQATWKLSDNTLTAPTGSVTIITPFASRYVNAQGTTPADSPFTPGIAEYECILLPQTIAAGTLSATITIGGNEYTWISDETSGISFEAGKQYSLKFSTGASMLVLGQFSAADWQGNTDENLTTD